MKKFPLNAQGVLNQTEFNYRYDVSGNGAFPDVVDVMVTLFDVTFNITLYKQGSWESSSIIKSNVLLNANMASSSNAVSLDFYKRLRLF